MGGARDEFLIRLLVAFTFVVLAIHVGEEITRSIGGLLREVVPAYEAVLSAVRPAVVGWTVMILALLLMVFDFSGKQFRDH